METTAEELAPKGSHNFEKYKISERYSVLFYTTRLFSRRIWFARGFRSFLYARREFPIFP